MHVVSDTATAPIVGPLPIDSGERHGMNWAVYMEGPTSFRFEVSRDGETLIRRRAEFPSAGKAGRAAEIWCDDEARGYEARAAEQSGEVEVVGDQANDTPPEDWTPALPAPQVVAGWTLRVAEEKGRGTWRCDVFNEATGEPAPADFVGYAAWSVALGEATAWGRANPCDGSVAPVDEPTASDVAELAEPTDPSIDQPSPIESPPQVTELEQLRHENARLQHALALRLADLDEAAEKADEATELKTTIDDLDDQIRVLKDEKKAAESRLELVNGKMNRAVKAAHDGSPHTYQRKLPLTFANDPTTRAEVVAGAAEVADQLGLTRPVAWAFNGVDYVIESEASGPGFGAWVRGHRTMTEAFDEDRGRAIEAAKTRASLVFADCDPGSSKPTPDPIADPPRKAKVPKLKGKTVDQVVTVVRGSKSIVDVIESIGCTLGELRKFEAKTGLDFGAELAKDTDLPEPPQQKVPARGRGRKQP